MNRLTCAAALALMAGQAMATDLVTIVTSPEPQTQLMAMVLTTQAVRQGASAHILLCGPAGDIALASPPESATNPQPPQGASPRSLLDGLVEAGAVAQVCAIYLPGAGLDASALAEGVTVASPPDMAAAMMAEGVRVWSF
ncbi:MAG: hypothetical protein ACK4WC_04185 [Rubrimonas sp.]